MSDEIVTIKIFSDATSADMALQLLEGAGISGFVLKDDAGGMEPQLQRTSGVRLLVNRGNATEAQQVLQTMTDC